MGNMWKDGRVVGAGLVVIALGAVGVGTATAVNSANTPEPTPPAVVETIDFASMPYTNGLAGEQETEAAAVVAEQARVAAEQDAAAAEAARVAAEQAAAVEAERVAAEQAVADEPADDGGSSEPEPSGGIPAVWVDLGNGSGMWDFSHCPSQSGSTGADGNVYCN